MVVFKKADERVAVCVDEHLIGHISPEHGFYMHSGHLATFIRISPEDLRQIADMAEKVKAEGVPELQAA